MWKFGLQRGLIDAMVVGLAKQVTGTLLDNCAIQKRPVAFSPRAPARGTGKVPEVMDVVSPGAPHGAREADREAPGLRTGPTDPT